MISEAEVEWISEPRPPPSPGGRRRQDQSAPSPFTPAGLRRGIPVVRLLPDHRIPPQQELANFCGREEARANVADFVHRWISIVLCMSSPCGAHVAWR